MIDVNAKVVLLRACLTFVLFCGGCAEGIVGTEDQIIGEDDQFTYVLESDYVIPIPHGNQVVFAGTGPVAQTVYLAFDGLTVQKGGWAQDNAHTNTSFIPAADVSVIPAFDHTPWGPRDQVIATIIDGLQSDFADFQVSFTSVRPTSGPYTLIVVGGSGDAIGRPGAGGIAPLDSGNWNKSDVAFVFSDVYAAYGYSARHLAWTIAHEFAHSVGLRHIEPASAIMNPVACHCLQSWQSGTVVGSGSGQQNSHELLAQVFLPSGAIRPAQFGTGNFDGGADDFYCHDPAVAGSPGRTWVAASDGSTATSAGIWLQGWCSHPGASFGTGDFNGDGHTDAYCHDPAVAGSPGRTWVATSDGTSFTSQGVWLGNWCKQIGSTLGTGDFDGDGKDDLWCHDPMPSSTGRTWVATSTGSGFAPAGLWLSGWCKASGARFGTGDFNGDGKDDLYCSDPAPSTAGRTWVATSDGTALHGQGVWLSNWCRHAGSLLGVGEFNGDGTADLWCHDPVPSATGRTWVATGTGTAITPQAEWSSDFCRSQGQLFGVADITGDGKSDLWCHDAIPSPEGNTWVKAAATSAFAPKALVLSGFCNHGL